MKLKTIEKVNTPFGEMTLRARTDGFTLNTPVGSPIIVNRVQYSTTFRSSWDYLKDATIYDNLIVMFREDNMKNATYAAQKKFVSIIVDFMSQGYENGDFSALIERTEGDKRDERIAELEAKINEYEAAIVDMRNELMIMKAAAKTAF